MDFSSFMNVSEDLGSWFKQIRSTKEMEEDFRKLIIKFEITYFMNHQSRLKAQFDKTVNRTEKFKYTEVNPQPPAKFWSFIVFEKKTEGKRKSMLNDVEEVS
jgi:Tfp pilus assembly protein PilP